MKLKYGCKVGGVVYPKGTILTPVDANHPLIQEEFPYIKNNITSMSVAGILPDRVKPTIFHISEVEMD